MYKPTIGLEIHVELNTKSKMFCSCKNEPDCQEPNLNICPICTGQPGTLPVPNLEAIKKVIKVGLALNCEIAKKSQLHRKNYFYPDLPKGYQISQYDLPLCSNGFLELRNGKKIRIRRIHIEEDAGKLLRSQDGQYTLIDYNRAGVPLMELVTEPDIGSSEEAKEFAKQLYLILKYLDVSDADMEKGHMRLEANVSLSKNGELGTKVEVKNINSFKFLKDAIDYEIERQKSLLEAGEKIVQETRGWNENKKQTVPQRTKEEAHDYRYFPEPDIPPFEFSDDFIKEVKQEIGELPLNKFKRFKKEYGLKDEDIEVLVGNVDLGNFFEQCSSEIFNWAKEKELQNNIPPDKQKQLFQLCCNYILSDLQGFLREKGISIKDTKLRAEDFAELILLIEKGKISSKLAKSILLEMIQTGTDPHHIIEEKGLEQISDENKLKEVISKVISANSKAVEDYKAGKQNAFQFLIGQIMKETKGKADPQKIRELLEKELRDYK
ncbi:Aspartyl/glutamyl-tRNA(Asn/Gln) amidotransferase subunit B [bacterium HR34]|nr:Aspartyl/glutamyl-tRNA(Asn/Gln) amidotransferase subunit B [bacterium HR34]